MSRHPLYLKIIKIRTATKLWCCLFIYALCALLPLQAQQTGKTQQKTKNKFVLSDFISEDYMQSLRIVGKKHDLTGIRVFDPKEAAIPNIGLVSMLDSETGIIKTVATQSKRVRSENEAYQRERQEYFSESFKKSGCGSIQCRVDESYVKKLLGYFKQKGR
jgi:hypothetical protein